MNNRVQEVSEISRSLKGLARDLDVPLLAVSQLSRAVESRPTRRPILSDLRESGSIEQDADVVAFIHREDRVYEESEWETRFPDRPYPKNLAEFIVAKHRHGPVDSVNLYFREEFATFENLASTGSPASMEFVGFPPGVKYTPIPNPVFGPLLEEMDDLEELKVTLRIHWMVHQKKGFPRFVTLQELMGDSTLARAIKAQGTDLEEALKKALSKAIQRHTLLHTTLQQHGKREEVYLPNTQANRRAVATLEGQESAPVGEGTLEPWQGPIERPNIFALYEQNIGMLTLLSPRR